MDQTVREAAQELGIPLSTLVLWCNRFGLAKLFDTKGRRLIEETEIHTIQEIQGYRSQGLSLSDIEEKLGKVQSVYPVYDEQSKPIDVQSVALVLREELMPILELTNKLIELSRQSAQLELTNYQLTKEVDDFVVQLHDKSSRIEQVVIMQRFKINTIPALKGILLTMFKNQWTDSQIFTIGANALDKYYPDQGDSDEGGTEWYLVYTQSNEDSVDLLRAAQELGVTAANFASLFGNYATAIYANADEYRAVKDKAGEINIEDLYIGMGYVQELFRTPLYTPCLGATNWGLNVVKATA